MRLCRISLCLLFVSTSALATTAPLPRPTALEPDIEFWRRVYTEISTQEGFVHDDRRLDIVYQTIRLPGGERARRRTAVAADERYVHALRAVAYGKRSHLNTAEQRVVALWGPNLDKQTLLAASRRVRFQLGQADRFRAGVIRAGAWQRYVKQTITDAGLPAEIAALPHVESSFNPAARSKVGAAGLWQFMNSTGRRYLRIDNVLDERLDPYRSTRAAALLLQQNFEVTGAWPLAITAYNHGAAGMRRAIAQVGSDDIVSVVRNYKSRSFGFASRNFYVALLAAVDVASNPDRYFGPLTPDPPDSSRLMTLPKYASAQSLATALDVDVDTLQRLNPSLKATVWSGSKYIPQGYAVRIPAGAGDPAVLLASVPTGIWQSAQTPDLYHIVQRGETLSSIAPRYGTRVSELIALNGLSHRGFIRAGQKLVLPAAVAGTSEAVVDQGVYPDSKASDVEDTDSASEPATAKLVEVAERDDDGRSDSDADTNTDSDTDNADAEQPLLADPSDYSVADDHTIRIQEDETIGHYADWLGVRASDLRHLNRMHGRSALRVGRRLKLDFAKVTPAQFEAARVAFHQAIQEKFFANHRIVATNEHIVRPGESMWVLAEHRYNVPIWLLRQYNPDLDLAKVRPKTRIVIPVLASPNA